MQHFIFSKHSLQIFNTLIRENYQTCDYFYKYEPFNFLHLDYLIAKYIAKQDDDYCFHIDLKDSFPDNKNTFPYHLSGLKIYYLLLSAIENKKNSFQFIFYSFHSKENIVNQYPVLRPDIEANNFIRLPIDSKCYDSIFNHNIIPQYAYSLLRGKYLFQKLNGDALTNYLKGKTVLVIDDEFEVLENSYKTLFECKIIGLKKAEIEQILADNYSSLENIDFTKIDLIIADLYLIETHKETPSNFLNAARLSGILFQRKIQEKLTCIKSLPLIFLTSSSRIWNFQQFKEFENFKAWVPKLSSTNIFADADLFRHNYELLYHTLKEIFDTNE